MAKRSIVGKTSPKKAAKATRRVRAEKTKLTATKKARQATPKITKGTSHGGLLRKLLEQKQKAIEQNQGKHPFAHAASTGGNSSPGNQKGFARFNGPRRRAA